MNSTWGKIGGVGVMHNEDSIQKQKENFHIDSIVGCLYDTKCHPSWTMTLARIIAKHSRCQELRNVIADRYGAATL